MVIPYVLWQNDTVIKKEVDNVSGCSTYDQR